LLKNKNYSFIPIRIHRIKKIFLILLKNKIHSFISFEF
jgi:hypothetical protein